MDDIFQINQAIKALEEQRSLLGDAVVDTALAPLREKLANLREQPPVEQRKLVTILFSDLVGYTALSSSIDPEDLHHIINVYFKQWAAAIEKFGGTVEKYIGDAVMAVFGLAASQEDEPERAIRSALEMRHVLDSLNQEMKGSLARPLAMRVGIHTGPVMVSLLGERKGQDFVVVGDTVNLASRLQSAAPSGGIIISHDTYRHIQGLFDLEALEPIQVKGKSEPVLAYLVKQAKQRAFRMESRGVEGIETRMIGRRVELQRLKDALEHTIQARKTRMVLVLGEAGIGKSRLMAEFEQWVDLQPRVIHYFKGRASPSMQNLPYSLLRDLFSFRFQILDSDSPQVLQEKIEQGISEFDYGGSPDETRIRAYIIGRLFGFKFENIPYLEGAPDDPRLLRDRAVTYVADYFQRLGAVRPVVILLEDLHWIDDASYELLTQLIDRLPSLPVLVVCAARPTIFERLAGLGQSKEESVYTLLNLQPLSRRDNLRLVSEILRKVERLPLALRNIIVERAEGNPFFTEELIKMLIEDGVILKDGDQWQVNSVQLASVQVPPTLVEVLQARFETLSQEERLLLQRASVLGRIFWDQAILAMERDQAENPSVPKQHSELLGQLSGREIIFPNHESTFTGIQEYHFKHALQRDVTYESVLKRVRRVYHAYAAAWLEEVTQRSQRALEFAALIAEHYELADDKPPAREWYLRGGDWAADHYANVEAIHCYTRCLELWPDQDLAGKAELLLKRVKIYDTTANRPAQQKDLESLQALVNELGDRARLAEDPAGGEGHVFYSWQARLALQWWRYHDALGDTQTAIEDAKRAVDFSKEAGDQELETRSYLYWGASAWKLPDFPTGQMKLQQALVLARQLQFPLLEADALRNLGIIYEYQGDFPAGEAHYLSALKIYQEIGNDRGMSMVLNSLGSVLLFRGDLREAKTYFERSLALKRKIGHRRAEYITLHNLGIVAAQLGNYMQARQYFEQELSFSREINDRESEADALLLLGTVSMYMGDVQQAQEQLEQSMAICQGGHAQISECEVLRTMGQLALQQGKLQEAGQYSQQAWVLAQELELLPDQLSARLISGRALLGAGQVEQAEEIFVEVVEAAQAVGFFGLIQEARAGAASSHLAAGHIGQAAEQVDQILAYLDLENPDLPGEKSENALEKVRNHFWVLYICCQVLAAAADGRAEALLDFTSQRLMEQARQLEGDSLRQSYLAIPIHHNIIQRKLD